MSQRDEAWDDAEQRDQQVARLFEVVFAPGDLIEFRTIGKPSPKQSWIEWTGHAGDLRDALDDVESRVEQSGHGGFFGANPRNGRGGTAEHVALARCLFVDFDPEAGSPAFSRQQALSRIEEATLPWPSAVVESGGGIHCYWRLDEAMTDLAAWSRLQRSLIRALKSDQSIHDPPRVMRLPGMLNAKRGRPATLVEAEPLRVYNVDEFAHLVEQAEQRDAEMKQRTSSIEVKAGGMSEMTRSLIERSVLLRGGGRRQSLFTAACDLRGHGWREQDAADLLLPVGSRLGLTPDEVDDLRRQIHNAFKKDRQPYSFDPIPIGDEMETERPEVPLPTLLDQLEAFKAYRQHNAGRRLVGLETGFERLDEKLSGLSGLAILAAAPGAGKTSMTLQLGLQILARNKNACFVFFSCEMMAREIAGRLLTMKTSLDYRRLALPGLVRGGAIDPKVAKADDLVIEEAIADLHDVAARMRMVPPDLIIEAANRGDLAAWMQRRTEQVMEETGTTEVVCILDNLQQAPFCSTRPDGSFTTDIERDRFAIESMMRLQHGLASQADRVATVAVSEVSKAAMKEGTVDMTAIIGSIRSVYKADCVMVAAKAERREKVGKSWRHVDLFAPKSDDPTAADFGRRCVDLIFTKARAPGERGRLLFAFDHRLHRMSEVSEAEAVRIERDEEPSDEFNSSVDEMLATAAATRGREVVSITRSEP